MVMGNELMIDNQKELKLGEGRQAEHQPGQPGGRQPIQGLSLFWLVPGPAMIRNHMMIILSYQTISNDQQARPGISARQRNKFRIVVSNLNYMMLPIPEMMMVMMMMMMIMMLMIKLVSMMTMGMVMIQLMEALSRELGLGLAMRM